MGRRKLKLQSRSLVFDDQSLKRTAIHNNEAPHLRGQARPRFASKTGPRITYLRLHGCNRAPAVYGRTHWMTKQPLDGLLTHFFERNNRVDYQLRGQP